MAMFHDGDIQSGIASALQQSKAVLCFVHDDTDPSRQWEDVLNDTSLSSAITAQTVALRLQAGSQEASFLSPICPITSTPAIVVIKNAQLQANLQSGEVSVHDLKDRLAAIFGANVQDVGTHASSEPEHAEGAQDTKQAVSEYLDLQPTAPGQMRLPNNAYDALRNYTQKLLDDGTAPREVFQTQLKLLANIPIFHEEVQRLRTQSRPEVSEYLQSRLLRLPAVGLRISGQTGPVVQPTPSSPSSSSQQTQPRPAAPAAVSAPSTGTASPAQQRGTAPPVPAQPEIEKQKAQRAEYIKMQREREQKQREERERIKAQIKADREERRRLDEIRKRGGDLEHATSTSASAGSMSTTSKARNSEIRVQIRTFDGSTLRSTFQPSSTLSADVRPWIDSNASDTTTNVPYNLKLILTPLPNRNIEAGEEELSLSDLGIVGSCTLVMVPVKGYVESYTGSTPGGLLGAAVSGGYNLVSGTAGLVLGGVRTLLGYNTPSSSSSSPPSRSEDSPSSAPDNVRSGGQGSSSTPAAPSEARTARVRTLADQRAESAGRDQQFYNGNQLNFEPKKDNDNTDKKD